MKARCIRDYFQQKLNPVQLQRLGKEARRGLPVGFVTVILHVTAVITADCIQLTRFVVRHALEALTVE